MGFVFEKRDLALVVFLVIKEAIARDALSSDTFDLIHIDDWVLTGRFSEVPVVVVSGGNIEM
jgi:hypothetical protein